MRYLVALFILPLGIASSDANTSRDKLRLAQAQTPSECIANCNSSNFSCAQNCGLSGSCVAQCTAEAASCKARCTSLNRSRHALIVVEADSQVAFTSQETGRSGAPNPRGRHFRATLGAHRQPAKCTVLGVATRDLFRHDKARLSKL